MHSVERHDKHAHRVVIVSDFPSDLPSDHVCPKENFDIIRLEELGIENLPEFILRYNVLELSTAIKPFALLHLMSLGYAQLVYFDPDIKVFSSLKRMRRLLARYNVLVTPHLTDELNDGRLPNELSILRAGSYNLGYIGVRATDESRRFLRWWRDRLRTQCINDQPMGYFVDQKWIDLVPGMFDDVHIVRDPGWNVAYWNLSHRPLSLVQKGQFKVNESPLVFFHFSGFHYADNVLSIHQDRHVLAEMEPPVQQLFDQYRQELAANDVDDVSATPYGYDKFGDGSAIPDILRQAYRECGLLPGAIPEFALDSPPQWLVNLMDQPAELENGSGPLVNFLGFFIYKARPDLQRAFPDIGRNDATAFGGWYVSSIEREYGLSPRFSTRVQQALEDQLEREAYQRAELAARKHRFRGVVRRLSAATRGLGARAKARADTFMDRHRSRSVAAFTGKTGGAGSLRNGSAVGVYGINVFGYLHAESGTGEAARSTIRACNAVNVLVSGVDVRLNNVSRMHESPDTETTKVADHPINLFHVNADQTVQVMDHLKIEAHSGRYNIGFWFWELGEFPKDYFDAYGYLDEIWVASSFCHRAISRHSSVPVTVVPLCVDLDPPSRSHRRDWKRSENTFLVLASMDMLSIPERKNPFAVLEAYAALRERTTRPTQLILKASNLDKCDEAVRQALLSKAECAGVELLDRYLVRQDLTDLMDACDCYLSLHRSEGFGLSLAEAMFLGKPVVATGWSANMDFMTNSNSYPVDFQLVELDRDYGPYRRGNLWAEPDVDHAAQCMLEILESPEQALLKSSLGSAHIREHYSPQRVGRLVQERLSTIARGVVA